MFFQNLHNQILLRVKSIGQVLSIRDVAQLVGDDFGLPNLRVDIAMRVIIKRVLFAR